MEQTFAANMQGQESNMDRESTIQKMAKLIQLNGETLFNQEGREDSFAYHSAESVATKLYDEHVVPSGDFSTKNIIHIMTTVNIQEAKYNKVMAELEAEYQKCVAAAKLQCEADKLKVNTESMLYKVSPDIEIKTHMCASQFGLAHPLV